MDVVRVAIVSIVVVVVVVVVVVERVESAVVVDVTMANQFQMVNIDEGCGGGDWRKKKR